MSAITSAGTGNWSDGSTWVGGTKPVLGDTVTISAGHTVTVNEDVEIGTNPANQTTFVLTVAGWLKWPDSTGASYTFKCKGNIQVNTGGKFSIGTATYPIPAAYTAILEFPSGAAGWVLIVRGHATTQASSGIFEVYGNPNYHMASASMQRAQLASAVSFGSDVTVQFDKNVDWTVGDVVWLAQGGDPATPVISATGADISGYGSEKVTIKTKTNASTYTVDLTYNHCVGDMAVHGTRNVIIKGTTNQGFQIRIGDDVTWQQKLPTTLINWASLQNGGYGTDQYKAAVYIYGYYLSTVEVDLWDGSLIQINNTVFDTPYATSIDYVYAFYHYGFYASCHMTQNALDEVHTWGYPYGVVWGSNLKGMVRVGHVSYLGSNNSGYGVQVESSLASLKVASFWGSAPAAVSTVIYGIRSDYNIVEVDAVKVHKLAYGVQVTNQAAQYHGGISLPVSVKNGEFYHTGTYGVRAEGAGGVFLKNCKFAGAIIAALYHGSSVVSPEIVLDNCEFNNCGRHASSDGAVCLLVGVSNIQVTLRKCKFGTTTVNNRWNIKVSDEAFVCGDGRIIMEDCEFKQQSNSPAGTAWWPEIYNWVICPVTVPTRAVRAAVPRGRTYEFVRPKVYNSSSVDQWPIQFSGITHHAITGGGGTISNEETAIRNGTFASTFSPYSFEVPNAGTYAAPIKIPTNNATLTVSVWIKKNVSLPTGKRPRLCLGGSALENVSSEMTDSVNTWEQVTVSALCLVGFAEVWVESGCNTRTALANDFVPNVPGTVIVYVDGFSYS